MEESVTAETLCDRLGEIEKSTKQLESRLRFNREAMRLQDEVIAILLPLAVEIAAGDVPDAIKRRVVFALKQIDGVAKRVAALNL